MAVDRFGGAMFNDPGSPGKNIGLVIVIVGIAFFLTWLVAIPACVIERLGLFDSLSRGHDLTKGNRLKILAVLLVCGVTAILINRVVGFALAVGLALAFGSAATFRPALSVIVPLFWITIWTAFWAVLLAVMYCELRRAKEGIDTDQITAIFD